MSTNPFCEIAVEEAVKLKENGFLDEVVALTIGPMAANDVLRKALSIGADKAIHIVTPKRLD